MARITIEDCLSKVDDRFKVVMLCAERTRELNSGSKPILDCNDKNIIVALREIAAGIDIEKIREAAINKYRRRKNLELFQENSEQLDEIEKLLTDSDLSNESSDNIDVELSDIFTDDDKMELDVELDDVSIEEESDDEEVIHEKVKIKEGENIYSDEEIDSEDD